MRILIVEDEIKLANAMRRALELQKYAVDVAYNGTDGLDLALGEKADVILLDIMLPGIDGIEICKKIRDQKIGTPILMLTAKGQVNDKVSGLDVGADDYLVKPFSFEELFARIRALVRRAATEFDPVIRTQDLILDPTSFKVTKGSTELELSTKEFSILEYLLRNKNRVISKEQIVNHVWNYSDDVLPNTVEVHVKHLRDKLDKNSSKPLIQTIRGRGYIIKDQK